MKIELIKSGIGQTARVKKTLKALKLTRLHKKVTIDDKNKAHVGMVNKIKHLIRVDEKK